ncbi:MAG: hypothetical protein AAF804_20445 [Bacteroidota bacterium]
MAQEEIERLQTELEHLRAENHQLRAEADFGAYPTHGDSATPLVPHDSLLPAFTQQLTRIKHANEIFQEAASCYRELEKSLETLVPALEFQIKGWHNQLQGLQSYQVETENAYASVVGQLESKIKDLKIQVENLQTLEKEVSRLAQIEQENQQLRQLLTRQSRPSEAHPPLVQQPLAVSSRKSPLSDKPAEDRSLRHLSIFDT